jgi:hypothetical protein
MLNLTMPECFVPESEIEGAPHRVEDAQNCQGYNWKPVEWSQIVRDGDGDIIFTHPQCKAMLLMLREVIGKPLFSVYFLDARRDYPGQVALGLPEGMTLDAEELAAVSMAMYLNATQFPGIKRTDSPLLPDDMNEYTAHPDSPVALDAVFYNMDDANQMASLLSTLYGAKPKVVRDGRRWGVIIHDDRFLNSTRVIELAGIHKLLGKYTIEPKADASSKNIPFAERIETQAAFESRVEDGINAILAHLGHLVAESIAAGADKHILPEPNPSPASKVKSSAKTLSTATGQGKGRGLDALIPVSGKKASPKKSA